MIALPPMTGTLKKLGIFAAVLLLLLIAALPLLRVPNTPEISKALDTTILDRFELHDATLSEASAIVMDHVYRQHPEMRKVRCIQYNASSPSSGAAAGQSLDPNTARITLSLTNIPASESFRYITSIANEAYLLRPGRIYLYPAGSPPPKTMRERLDAAIDALLSRN